MSPRWPVGASAAMFVSFVKSWKEEPDQVPFFGSTGKELPSSSVDNLYLSPLHGTHQYLSLGSM
eukprot:m.164704 g.164704  ORF g.164704 m.164704 type:complete len:64 (-) comp15225_c9_seq3:12-203(-)